MPILLRIAILGVLLGVVPAAAQWSPAPPDSARRDFRQRLLQALELSPDQRDSLRLRREILQTELQALRQQVDDGGVLPEEGRLRYRELLEGYRNDRDSLLTSEQRALLGRAREHEQQLVLSDGQPAPEAPLRLVDALELTEDQRHRWLALLARQRTQVQQLQEAGQVITSEDILRLREEHRLVFEAILTDVPDSWLKGGYRDEAPDAIRDHYLEYLVTRLEGSAAFVEEAARA